MTAEDVLRRYEEEDLPAFCGVRLTHVNQAGLFGERPLDVASVRGNLDEIRALLEAGAEVNASGELGNTALHEAVAQGHLDAVRILLRYGAKADMQNELGKTAIDIARSGSRDEILSMLRENTKD